MVVGCFILENIIGGKYKLHKGGGLVLLELRYSLVGRGCYAGLRV